MSSITSPETGIRSWCRQAPRLSQTLEALHQEFNTKGFTVVGLESWSRRGPYRLEIYRKQYGLTYPLLYDGPPYGVGALGSPSIALFDRQGRLVAFINRG